MIERYKKISICLIILSNLLPIVSFFVFDWSLFSILIYYWIESAVVGIFTIIKLIRITFYTYEDKRMNNEYQSFISKNNNLNNKNFLVSSPIITSFANIFYIFFFCIHYSGFMLGHLVFILFIGTIGDSSITLSSENILSTLLNLLIFSFALILSHGFSFFRNFIGNKEYEKINARKIMFSPYKRIFLMHFTIIIGFFIIFITKLPNLLALLFILVKTVIDVNAHLNEHEF